MKAVGLATFYLQLTRRVQTRPPWYKRLYRFLFGYDFFDMMEDDLVFKIKRNAQLNKRDDLFVAAVKARI